MPFLVKKQGVVVVGQDSRREGPWTVETTAVGVATAKGMGASKSYNLLVIEAHAVKDVP